MCNEAVIRRFAGVFILLGISLAALVHPAWCALGAFVGLNLLQSSLTGLCPLERVLGAVGFPGCRRRGAGA